MIEYTSTLRKILHQNFTKFGYVTICNEFPTLKEAKFLLLNH
jgi:hypothetical protein